VTPASGRRFDEDRAAARVPSRRAPRIEYTHKSAVSRCSSRREPWRYATEAARRCTGLAPSTAGTGLAARGGMSESTDPRPFQPDPDVERMPADSAARTLYLIVRAHGPRVSKAWAVATRLAAKTRTLLRATSVLVLSHDARRGTMRVIGVDGACADEVLGAVVSTRDDFVAAAVLANARTLQIHFDGVFPQFVPKRFHTVGGRSDIVALPVMCGGACVAIVEIVDMAARVEQRIERVRAALTERLVPVLVPEHHEETAQPSPRPPEGRAESMGTT
jgi:hypothetical protein